MGMQTQYWSPRIQEYNFYTWLKGDGVGHLLQLNLNTKAISVEHFNIALATFGQLEYDQYSWVNNMHILWSYLNLFLISGGSFTLI